MGVDFWSFKIKESSKALDPYSIHWEDEHDSYKGIYELLPNNYFSDNGFSDDEWLLFRGIGMGVYGNPYMPHEKFKESVDIFNKWYENNKGRDYELWDSHSTSIYPRRVYTESQIDDLYEFLSVWVEEGHGCWISM